MTCLDYTYTILGLATLVFAYAIGNGLVTGLVSLMSWPLDLLAAPFKWLSGNAEAAAATLHEYRYEIGPNLVLLLVVPFFVYLCFRLSRWLLRRLPVTAGMYRKAAVDVADDIIFYSWEQYTRHCHANGVLLPLCIHPVGVPSERTGVIKRGSPIINDYHCAEHQRQYRRHLRQHNSTARAIQWFEESDNWAYMAGHVAEDRAVLGLF